MRRRITIGILLIVIGVAVCSVGIGGHIAYLYEKYQGFAEYGYFDSFAHYYWEIGKANLVVSAFLGLIPFFCGLYLLCVKPWWYERLAANTVEESPKG